VNWLVDKVREAQAQGLLRESVDAFATRLGKLQIRSWRGRRAGSRLQQRTQFSTPSLRTDHHFHAEVPYAYRYLIPVNHESRHRGHGCAKVLREEVCEAKLESELTGSESPLRHGDGASPKEDPRSPAPRLRVARVGHHLRPPPDEQWMLHSGGK